MNLRLVATPFAGSLPPIGPRAGGFPHSLRPALHACGAAAAQVERLADPDALVVTTGQQPGLFTGPLYTVFKALSAAALARRLEARWERPVVPVFWSAGDDHDFAEANHASWIGRDGDVHTAVLRTRSETAPLTPMYREVLGPDVARALAALADDIRSTEFGDGVLDWLGRSHRPDVTVAAAYEAALAELLGPAGVVVLESTHAAVKEAARPLMLRALERSLELDAALSARAAELTAAGHDPGVVVGDGATLVMLEGAGGRDRLVRIGEGRYETRRSRERFTLAELETLAAAEPRRVSPNVLLRPVVESAPLPTVAYVAGPGELRYFGLTPPLYRELGVPAQAPVPRWSGILIEPVVDRVLSKFELDLPHLLDAGREAERRLVADRIPPSAREGLARVRAELDAGYAQVAAAAGEVDPTLVRWVEGVRNRALGGTRDVETKLVRHLKRRRDTELSQLLRARTVVRPGGGPQERVLTIAPFLARHGPGVIEAVSAAAGTWYAGALEAAPAGE